MFQPDGQSRNFSVVLAFRSACGCERAFTVACMAEPNNYRFEIGWTCSSSLVHGVSGMDAADGTVILRNVAP